MPLYFRFYSKIGHQVGLGYKVQGLGVQSAKVRQSAKGLWRIGGADLNREP